MYNDTLRDGIRDFVSLLYCKTLDDMIAKAREQEIYFELLSKWRPAQTPISEGKPKRSKTIDSRSRDHQGLGHCAKYGKNHEGGSQDKGGGCF